MTHNDIHTCSYSCERPACIRAQRDELAQRLLELVAEAVAAEKDKEIERLQDMLYELLGELTALRAEKQMRGYIKQLKDSAAETTIDVSGTEEEQPR